MEAWWRAHPAELALFVEVALVLVEVRDAVLKLIFCDRAIPWPWNHGLARYERSDAACNAYVLAERRRPMRSARRLSRDAKQGPPDELTPTAFGKEHTLQAEGRRQKADARGGPCPKRPLRPSRSR
jgi:hypothetical protein